jgi:uncharacterized integral membrane protein
MKTKIVIAVLLLAFVIIFSIQNATDVVLFSLEIHTRRAVLIFSALYIGFIIGRFSKYVEPVIETKKRK